MRKIETKKRKIRNLDDIFLIQPRKKKKLINKQDEESASKAQIVEFTWKRMWTLSEICFPSISVCGDKKPRTLQFELHIRGYLARQNDLVRIV